MARYLSTRGNFVEFPILFLVVSGLAVHLISNGSDGESSENSGGCQVTNF